MEQYLEHYRKQLKIQNIFSVIFMIAALAVILLVNVYMPHKGYVLPNSDARWRDFWDGFLSGVSAAFFLLSFIGLVKNLRAMRAEETLRAMYIKAHDERTRQIQEKAGGSSYWFYTMGLLLAAIIAGWFSPLAFFCILGCLLYFCLLQMGLKLFYCKKL